MWREGGEAHELQRPALSLPNYGALVPPRSSVCVIFEDCSVSMLVYDSGIRKKENHIFKAHATVVMLKSQLLCASVLSQISETGFWVKHKSSFIVLPDKGGHSWLIPSEACVPTWGDSEQFYSSSSKRA